MMILDKQQKPSITDADAAISLCVLSGGSRTKHPVSPCPPIEHMDAYPTLSPSTAAAIELPRIVEDDLKPMSMNLSEDFQASVPINNTLPNTNRSSMKAPAPAKKSTNTRGKYVKRVHPVSFDEMKRLMRVYGPIKCLRNRRNSQTRPGAITKDTSIKRKFYRWFPDFNERFELTPEGWFLPKFGHEYEMKYREAMRMSDQKVLVKKRCAKRCGPKSFFDTPAMNDSTVSIPL
jgi:hypothetical protein